LSLREFLIVAGQALGNIGDARAVPPLVELITDERVYGRGYGRGYCPALVVKALGQIGGTSAIDPLITVLADIDVELRIIAVEALGRSADARAVKPLFALLVDLHNEVRKVAAVALANLQHPEWINWIKGDDDDMIRLGSSGHPNACDLLIAVLAVEFHPLRQGAAEMLGKLRDVRAVEPLTRALTAKSADVRSRAAEALGQLGDARAVEPLIRVLEDYEDQVRRNAAVALGQIGDFRAVEPLIGRLILHGDCRHAIGNALVKLGAVAVEPLMAVLIDKRFNYWGPACVVETLGKLGDTRAVEILIQTLANSNESVREKAATALTQLGQTQWSNWIKGDDDDFSRLAASGCVRAFELLICGLKNGAPTAAHALGKLGDPAALEPLIAALASDHHPMREAAVEALVRLDDVIALAPLIELLNQAQPISLMAVVSLGRKDPQLFGSLLTDVLTNSQNVQTRRNAAEILVMAGVASVKRHLPAVIMDWLEFKRGVGIGEDVGLIRMAELADLDPRLLQLATAAIGYRISTKTDHPGGNMSASSQSIGSYDGGMDAITKLCDDESLWSSCILYRASRKKPVSVTLSGCFDSTTEEFDFLDERQAALRELDRRGLTNTNPLKLMPS